MISTVTPPTSGLLPATRTNTTTLSLYLSTTFNESYVTYPLGSSGTALTTLGSRALTHRHLSHSRHHRQREGREASRRVLLLSDEIMTTEPDMIYSTTMCREKRHVIVHSGLELDRPCAAGTGHDLL
ncbi:hypothetical protein [Amycolatopsis keratiniphila]|uniref:hypothetical protein n=1 Tax=Amycolatopsis keratiniphila TaxID=129921 RepID=UPI00117F9FFD|nr:hypothetical protein [Amycolatopsis keratiniphila]